MTEKFTKEPWEISDMSCVDAMDNYTACFHIGISSTGEMIADCQSDNKADYERVKANAHLIAAAPEMYALLKMIADPKTFMGAKTDETLRTAIESVLKKARGERNENQENHICDSGVCLSTPQSSEKESRADVSRSAE